MLGANASDFEIPLVSPGQNGVPPCDYTTDGGNAGPGGGPLCDVDETDFVPGQRTSRQSPQKRADITIQKNFPIKERYNLNYQFEVFNVTNTASFDVPSNSVNLNPNYSELNGNEDGQQVQPTSGTVATPTGPQVCQGSSRLAPTSFYSVPNYPGNTLGVVQNAIGSSRVVEMSMHITF